MCAACAGDSKGVTLQAYSPLGDGTSELITGDLVSGIGKAHNKTGAQVSMKWIAQQGTPLSTKSTKASHLSEDLDVYSGWQLSDADMQQLTSATKPKGTPSFMCSK